MPPYLPGLCTRERSGPSRTRYAFNNGDHSVRKSKLVTLDDVLFLGANTVKEFRVETALYLCMSGGLARNMARLRWRYPRTYRFSNVSSALLYTALVTTVCRKLIMNKSGASSSVFILSVISNRIGCPYSDTIY